MKLMLVMVVVASACGATVEANDDTLAAPRTTQSLAEAVACGVVRMEARGGGGSRVALELEARADVDVVIAAGTYFRATADVQNMVVTTSVTAHLDRGTRTEVV